MKSRYWIFVVAVVGLVFVFDFVVRNAIESSTPDLESWTLDQLMHNTALIDSIGGSRRFEIQYNENDFHFADSGGFVIIIEGPSRTLTYRGVGLREAGTLDWQIFHERLTIE